MAQVGSADFFRSGLKLLVAHKRSKRSKVQVWKSTGHAGCFIRTWRCFSALGNVMTHFMMHSHSNYSHSAACVCVPTIDRNMAWTGSGWLCWFEVGGRKKNGNYAGVVYQSWSVHGFSFLAMLPPETANYFIFCCIYVNNCLFCVVVFSLFSLSSFGGERFISHHTPPSC